MNRNEYINDTTITHTAILLTYDNTLNAEYNY